MLDTIIKFGLSKAGVEYKEYELYDQYIKLNNCSYELYVKVDNSNTRYKINFWHFSDIKRMETKLCWHILSTNAPTIYTVWDYIDHNHVVIDYTKNIKESLLTLID